MSDAHHAGPDVERLDRGTRDAPSSAAGELEVPLIAAPGADARRAAEPEVRAALELMPQLVWTTTADGYHDYYNERWYAYTGMPRPGDPAAGNEGWNWKTYLHPDDHARTLDVWRDCLRTAAPYDIEYRLREAASGEYRWFLARALPMLDANGRVVRWFGTCTDVHEQKEQTLRLAAARAEVEAHYIEATEHTERLRAQAEQLEQQAVELELSMQQLQDQQVELETMNEQLVEQREELETQTDGLQETAAALERRSQLAERARAEAEAARAETELVRTRAERILESVADAYFALDAEFRIIGVNAAMERGSGLARAELLGHVFWELFPASVGTDFERFYRGAVVDRQEAHFTHDYSDGRLDLVVDVDAYPTEDGVAVFWRDVTQTARASAERERLLAAEQEARAEAERATEQAQQTTVELEAQAEELQAIAAELEERTAEAEAAARRAQFAGDVGTAITSGGGLAETMQRCCQAAVDHLGAAFARVWLLDPSEDMLVLTASAGLYTHLDGGHGRVRVGQFKIGQIAAERRPHITNGVVGDPRVNDQAWAAREGMVAFAGYPLVVGEELVGVIALFARQVLSEADFTVLATAATAISVAIASDRHLDAERRARADAETANRAKSEFLSAMSHELRTPLNAISGYAELLKMGVRGPVSAAQVHDLERIHLANQHLLSLINDILNFARLDAGQIQFHVGEVELATVVDEVEPLVTPQLETKGLKFDHDGCSADTPECPHVVLADPDRLRQVLLNLLTNAIKFTATGGRIRLACETDAAAGVARIRVSDTGRGIPESELSRIFEPFVQVDRHSTHASQQGIGLGLAISRDLARGMGGELTVESEPAVGSTFTLTLPLAPRDPAA